MKRQLAEGVTIQKSSEVVYVNEEAIHDKVNEITDRVISRIVKEEYKASKTNIGRPAQVIRRETEAFIKKQQRQPRIILMQNHGVIALGASWQAVLTAMLMAEKAARIFVGAAALGGPVFMSEANVQRIAGRPDEAYRQRELKM